MLKAFKLPLPHHVSPMSTTGMHSHDYVSAPHDDFSSIMPHMSLARVIPFLPGLNIRSRQKYRAGGDYTRMRGDYSYAP